MLEDVSRIRALVVEGKTDQAILQHHAFMDRHGKTDQAILQHHFFMDRRVTLAHVQAR
ncbi:hypothetical protein T484DRAFT_1857622 [Baffinella frigidus]|nr:hypothetical protein T484DRAFT_1857622 [Cryptophyta sp. CCMP2293]